MAHPVRPPGPRGLPLLGNVLDFKLGGDLLAQWRTLHEAFGDALKVSFGPVNIWSFACPDAVQEVLVTQHKAMRKGFAYAGLRKLLGEGLVTTDAPHWASQRQRLNPLFSPPATEDYAGVIFDAVTLGVNDLASAAAGGKTVDVGEAMVQLTMRVIAGAAFGVDLGERHVQVAEAFNYAFSYMADSVARPLRPPLFVPTAGNRHYRRALHTIETFVDGLIARAAAAPGDNSMNGQIFAALVGNTHQMLRDEVISLYFAGFETTARAMTFLIYELARNPHLLEPLRQEAATFKRPDGALAVLKQLPLACEIVNETLRLYPPVALVARELTRDCDIAGQSLKAGSLAVINIFLTQRNPAWWPAGDHFAPDLANPLQKRIAHRGAYAPFGAGPRICLGKHFALVEMAMATALLAANFDWSLVDERPLELEFVGTIRPRSPIRASFTPYTVLVD